MTYYRGRHRSQLGPGTSAITRSSGCTWTSCANGADTASVGAVDKMPDEIHDLVRNSEETNPVTPGWSLRDAKLAMDRLGVPFEIRSGRGWTAALAALDAGCGILLQGDSDRFGGSTCSGAFDGDHAIFVHPQRDAAGLQLISDPICPDWRWETRAILKAYAEKLSSGVLFGVFSDRVPYTEDTMPDISHKIERWTLDGGPGQVTTYGAPYRADGTVDYSQRLAFVSGRGGGNPRLTMIPRTRLTNPRVDQDEPFRTALAAYELPSGGATPDELEQAARTGSEARAEDVRRRLGL